MCETTKRQQYWQDIVIEKCNETKYRTISPGICGSCPECQSQWGMQLEQSDFELDVWQERDRLFIGLRDKYNQDFFLIEYWDQDAQFFLEDYGIGIDDPKLFGFLWEEADNQDLISNVPSDTFDSIMNEKVSREVYIDEGGFSWHNCDCCGNPLGGDRFAAHGIDENEELLHYDVCCDCLFYLANGDLPSDEDLDWIDDNEDSAD